ncbi:MAG: hypothetical protein ACJAS4_003698 [Bacteriovoracaceae bacterium]|jgi:hypothetical protein
MKPVFKKYLVSVKEFNLIIDEIISIIYSELVKHKSSPNAEVPQKSKGGN